jgi:manganese/zinc/iron transport system ATP- binding protein
MLLGAFHLQALMRLKAMGTIFCQRATNPLFLLRNQLRFFVTAKIPQGFPMPQTVLTVRDLSLSYDADTALHNISFDVPAGDMLAIIGPNGAGKSSLLKAIMGLVQGHKGGMIEVERSRLGYVPQHQAVDWQFPVTVRDVVRMGLARQIGWLRFPKQEHHQRVEAALERVGMAKFAKRQIGELSGGQRQRVFIARALAQNNDILLLDEPFAGVDASTENELLNSIGELNQDGITILLTTHDLNMAFKRFKRVLAIKHRLVGIGSPQEMYTPEILTELYGGGIATLHNGEATVLFVDEEMHCN